MDAAIRCADIRAVGLVLFRAGWIVVSFANSENLPMTETTITLGTGDAVVLYTDGVTEAWHPQRNEEYGVGRLTAAITAAPRQAGELLAHVEADLNAFIEDTPQQDDVTILVLTAD
jgi:phosphoserine phosphatase RsbU/P